MNERGENNDEAQRVHMVQMCKIIFACDAATKRREFDIDPFFFSTFASVSRCSCK